MCKEAMTLIHVSWTNYTQTKLPVLFCPTCKCKRRMLAQFQDWYGWSSTCLSCGDGWQDGEMRERPARPRWRQESIAHAKAAWLAYKQEIQARRCPAEAAES